MSHDLRKDKRSREKANSEIWNCENDNLSKKSRGKEKISDSKCSWPLLSDSSDRGTDRTFSYSHDYSDKWLCKRANIETWNRENDNLPKQSRGKEKIILTETLIEYFHIHMIILVPHELFKNESLNTGFARLATIVPSKLIMNTTSEFYNKEPRLTYLQHMNRW
ncbi:hypothetical protein CR513_49968, partial [Mucuna pruriens]